LAAELISQRIVEPGDWRGETLRMRRLITEADPDVVEEWKWMNPIESHDGIICTGESYKKVVKLTFAKGASLKDPARLFNSSLDGKRIVDINAIRRRSPGPGFDGKIVLTVGGREPMKFGDGRAG